MPETRNSSLPASSLSELAQAPTVDKAVAAVREFLGMDVAFTSQFVDGEQVLEAIHGDWESFGVPADARIPLDQTYCAAVLAGRLPNLIPDTRADDRARNMPITEGADIGAFVSVPLRFSDGSLYGTLCAANHESMEDSLGYRELQFLQVFARMVADQLERAKLEAAAHELQMQAAGAKTLIAAVEARDAYTGEHSQAVVKHATDVARALGLPEEQVIDVAHVALLHDIGKIAIPDAVLRKPGRLTAEEWEIMRTHPIASERLICNVEGLSHLSSAIRAEHEHWDGSGYPDGLAGADIPIASRITLVCDAYHAMTSDRPYRGALSQDEARAELIRSSGIQFCPHATRALLEILDADG
jgi:response regulator RpfG family c-di-GMP phosphodiesterase